MSAHNESPVLFYSIDEPFGCFSNFSRHPIELDGKTWPTSEHYFQAQKFAGTPHEEAIRQAASAMEAACMGRERSRPLRADWEAVKVDVMKRALLAKFTQHSDLRDLLLGTGNRELIERTPHDASWADGGDGSGMNMLGKLLMELRAQLLNNE